MTVGEKVFDELLAAFAEHRLGMKLDAVNRAPDVRDALNDAVFTARVNPQVLRESSRAPSRANGIAWPSTATEGP